MSRAVRVLNRRHASVSRRDGLIVLAATGLSWTAAHAAPAPRIVSVGGALTETLFAIGAQDLVVGCDTTSLHPPEASRLPSVGYARALSAEGVLSLRPTLVVATGEAGPPAVMQQIEAAGVRRVTLDADHRIEGVFERTERLGGLSGRADEAGALLASMRRDWARVQTQVEQAARRGAPARVLFVLSHSINQVRVAGRDTGADAMIRYAGARNALDGMHGYKPLTPEAVIAAAPDLILTTDQGRQAAGGIDGFLRMPGLAQTPAGRRRRVIALDALLLLGFGPRMPRAVGELAQALHRSATP